MSEYKFSDEILEAAAVSAEDWDLHGRNPCSDSYFNEDGFT